MKNYLPEEYTFSFGQSFNNTVVIYIFYVKVNSVKKRTNLLPYLVFLLFCLLLAFGKIYDPVWNKIVELEAINRPWIEAALPFLLLLAVLIYIIPPFLLLLFKKKDLIFKDDLFTNPEIILE